MDGVNVALGNRGMTVEASRQCAKDRKEWRSLVHMYLNEFHVAIWLARVFFRTALPCSCGYNLERDGMPLHETVKRAQLLNTKVQMSSIWAKGYTLMIVCVLSDLT